jgi:hypothetical protein
MKTLAVGTRVRHSEASILEGVIEHNGTIAMSIRWDGAAEISSYIHGIDDHYIIPIPPKVGDIVKDINSPHLGIVTGIDNHANMKVQWEAVTYFVSYNVKNWYHHMTICTNTPFESSNQKCECGCGQDWPAEKHSDWCQLFKAI